MAAPRVAARAPIEVVLGREDEQARGGVEIAGLAGVERGPVAPEDLVAVRGVGGEA